MDSVSLSVNLAIGDALNISDDVIIHRNLSGMEDDPESGVSTSVAYTPTDGRFERDPVEVFHFPFFLF